MNATDFFLLALLLLGFYTGWKKGLIAIALQILALGVILFFGFELTDIIQIWLTDNHIVDSSWIVFVSYLIMLIGVALAIAVIRTIISQVINTIGLGIFNRILGGAFGIVKNYIIGMLMLVLFNKAIQLFNIDIQLISQSQLYPFYMEGINWVSSLWQ